MKNDEIPTRYSVTEYGDRIKTVGRSVLRNGALTGDWSGCGIEFAADCRGDVAVDLELLPAAESPYEAGSYFTVYVDGVRRPERLLATAGRTLLKIASDLPEGKHTFSVYRQSTNLHANMNVYGLLLTGTLSDRPADRDRYLEFIGDSIVCGWGVIVEETDNFEPYPYSDATQSFAFVTAEALHADYSFVARCGWGICTTAPGENIPDIYRYVCYSRDRKTLYDFSRKPDAIVLNIGTNDYCRFTAEQLVPKGMDFLADVREKNGYGVPLVLVWDMMNDSCIEALTEIVNRSGGEEKGIFLLRLPRGTSGGGLHPDVTEHKAAAELLSRFLRTRVLNR